MPEDRKAARQHIVAEADKLYAAGHSREAAAMLQPCLSLFDDTEKGGDEWGRFCMALGSALAESGNPKAAEHMFRAAVLALEGNPDALATAYFNLGNVYAYINSRQPAYDSYSLARKIFRDGVHHRGEAQCLLSLANLFFSMGAPDRAQEFLSQFEQLPADLQKDPAIRWSYQMQLAHVRVSKHETISALETLKQALLAAELTGDPGYLAQTQSSIGQVRQQLGDLPGALAAIEKAYDEARAENSPRYIDTAWQFAIALESAGSEDRALAIYRECLDQIDLLRTQLDFGERFRVMERYSQIACAATTLLFKRNACAEAFEVSERGQARATLDLMFRHQRKRQGERPIRAARQDRISLDSPGVAALEMALVGSNVHLLKLYRAERKLFVWFLAPNASLQSWEATVALEPLADVTSMLIRTNVPPEPVADAKGVGADVEGIPPRSRPPWINLEQALRRFWEALLTEDVRKYLLEQSGKLLILPHRELCYVPFAAIPQEDNQPIGHRWEVATAPSAGVFLQLDPRRDPEDQPKLCDDARGALAIGGVGDQTITVPLIAGFPEPSITLRFRRLPMTSAEANRVIELFGGTVLIGSEANADAVCQMMPEHRLIHFATHGYWNPAGDISLLLVGDSALTSEDVIELPLRAELAVLSACQTGLGLPHPDSYTGVAQNFLIGGARSVLMALWPIDDSATLLFMERFYLSLKQGNSPAESLMTAQRTMRENPDMADGYNWAAFQFVGHPFASSPTQKKFAGPVFSGGDFVQTTTEPGALLALENFGDVVQGAGEALILTRQRLEKVQKSGPFCGPQPASNRSRKLLGFLG
jgi:tetratricopeptide (TPR) repeat protein